MDKPQVIFSHWQQMLGMRSLHAVRVGWGFIKVASWEEVLNRNINPGKVFGPTLPLAQVADGYGAMDERRAIKALLRP